MSKANPSGALCNLEARYDGPLPNAWRQAARLRGADELRRARHAADARLFDRLARDCVTTAAAARRRLADGAGEGGDAAILAAAPARLSRLRHAGVAAFFARLR
ncbi:hypothetical protein [Ferruginivarius sediminum]|uniref:Uncharacterized protein n=1 Tax=Ferruginivarius sediminum TaxID=2661937 RepID=A0A369T705_9PROT|nr:hypothetical protein [Ferruginivarius sediminum]RDD61058.1 hypothetical protein DRB17_15145 [Ferruginivarius sediminum]